MQYIDSRIAVAQIKYNTIEWGNKPLDFYNDRTFCAACEFKSTND